MGLSTMVFRGRVSTNGNGAAEPLLDELSELVKTEGFISDIVFRRLVLKTLVDLHTRLGSIESNMQRDWTPVIVAAVMAVGTIAATLVANWINP